MRQRDGDLDLASNFAEVVEATPREVEELAPLIGLGVGGPARLVHELEHEWAARADVGAPREEVAANESLEDAGLAAALAPDHGHLRQVDRGAAPQLREDVLQLVDDRDHRGPDRGRRSGRRGRRRRRRGRRGGEVVFGHGPGGGGARTPPLGWPRVLDEEGKGNEKPGRGSLDRELLLFFLPNFFFLVLRWGFQIERPRGGFPNAGEGDARAIYLYSPHLLGLGNKKNVLRFVGMESGFRYEDACRVLLFNLS